MKFSCEKLLLQMDADGVLVFYFREFGVVVSRQGCDVVRRIAAGQTYVCAAVGGKSNDVIGQAAEDFVK